MPRSARDSNSKFAKLVEEEKERRTEAAELSAKVRSALGRRKAQVERGPAGCGGVSGAPDGRDHAQLCQAVEVERIRPRGDVHIVGDGEDGFETDALLSCRWILYVRYATEM
jgi:hypothetical protein